VIFAVHGYCDCRLQNFTLPRELSAWRATENASWPALCRDLPR
jgi:hypothetical protein